MITKPRLEVEDGRGSICKPENAPRAVIQWCVDNKYSVRKIPADGDCLYRALGHSMGSTPIVCRQHIAESAKNCWKEIMDHDPEHRELPGFVRETLESGKWGGAQQILVFAHTLNCRVNVHRMEGDPISFGEGGQTIDLLYSNAAGGHGNPDHYDLIWPNGQQRQGQLSYEEGAVNAANPNRSKRARGGNGSTKVCTVNVTGSFDQFQNALDIQVDVLMIQEHWRNAKDIGKWKVAADYKGWHGVWSYADATDKGAASGGVAILVRLGRPIFATPAVNDARFVGAVISWTRRVKTGQDAPLQCVRL